MESIRKTEDQSGSNGGKRRYKSCVLLEPFFKFLDAAPTSTSWCSIWPWQTPSPASSPSPWRPYGEPPSGWDSFGQHWITIPSYLLYLVVQHQLDVQGPDDDPHWELHSLLQHARHTQLRQVQHHHWATTTTKANITLYHDRSKDLLIVKSSIPFVH